VFVKVCHTRHISFYTFHLSWHIRYVVLGEDIHYCFSAKKQFVDGNRYMVSFQYYLFITVDCVSDYYRTASMIVFLKASQEFWVKVILSGNIWFTSISKVKHGLETKMFA